MVKQERFTKRGPERISLVAAKLVGTILYSWQLGQNPIGAQSISITASAHQSISTLCQRQAIGGTDRCLSPRVCLCRCIYPQTAQGGHHHYAHPETKTQPTTNAPASSFPAGLSPSKPGVSRHLAVLQVLDEASTRCTFDGSSHGCTHLFVTSVHVYDYACASQPSVYI